MDALQRWLTLVTLVAAALAALAYIVRQVWRGFRLVEKISNVILHELAPNSGSSMKDDLAAIARHVGQLQADVADLSESKDKAHAVLQIQLDSLVEELGPPSSHRHRRPPDDPA